MERSNAGSDPKLSGWARRDDNRADDNQVEDRRETRNEMRDHSPHTEHEPLGPAPTPGPMTPAIKTLQPADAPIGEPGENEEDRLDEALQESMGTSDPVSIKIA